MKYGKWLGCAAAFVGTIALLPLDVRATLRCSALFDSTTWTVRETQEEKVRFVQQMIQNGFENDAYVVRWKALTKKAQGPLDPGGDLLVTSVTGRNADLWMKEIGTRSIGLSVRGLPESNPGTASLRVGDRMFSFSVIQQPLSSEILQLNGGSLLSHRVFNAGLIKDHSAQYTEATFLVTREEMSAVLDFISARQWGIKASRNIGRSYKEGDVIRPGFDSHKFTLKEESCAAACTSWMDPKWLEHYQSPGKEVLLRLAERLKLKPTYVAKQNIWANSRNDQALGITLFGLDAKLSEGQESAPLIETNKWYKLRGIPVHGLIPDPIGKSTTVESKRLTLSGWISELH